MPAMAIRHVIYYNVFPLTCCGPFSEAFLTPLGDNILSQEFAAERLIQLETQLSAAPHSLAKPKFRCKKGCGVLQNAKNAATASIAGKIDTTD